MSNIMMYTSQTSIDGSDWVAGASEDTDCAYILRMANEEAIQALVVRNALIVELQILADGIMVFDYLYFRSSLLASQQRRPPVRERVCQPGDSGKKVKAAS